MIRPISPDRPIGPREFGDRDIKRISEDNVDIVIIRLTERRKLNPIRNQGDRPIRSGKPLSGATINRYITQLASLYKYAKTLYLLPRSLRPLQSELKKHPSPLIRIDTSAPNRLKCW